MNSAAGLDACRRIRPELPRKFVSLENRTLMDTTVKKIAWTSCVVGSLAAALILYLFDPTRVRIYPVCVFHRLTGLDCPGCGSLRALHQLLHGNLREAFHFNALLIVSLPVFAWLGCRIARSEMMQQRPAPIRPVWVWLFIAAWILFGTLRNVPAFSGILH
jgi:hypothetical protein